MNDRIARGALATFAALALTAAGCDREDARDVREGVEQGADKVEEGADKVEKEVDENVDTDGKDN